MREPDLFDWAPDGERPEQRVFDQPAGCVLVPFPLHLRLGKVRTVARTLAARRTEAGRARYWTRVIGDLSAELRRHGASPSEIELQVAAFTDAVAAIDAPTNARGTHW